jgi:hypothetical protein
MPEICFREFGANQKRKEQMLREMGIDYKMEFISSNVPCQTQVNYVVYPKNKNEVLIAFGLLN